MPHGHAARFSRPRARRREGARRTRPISHRTRNRTGHAGFRRRLRRAVGRVRAARAGVRDCHVTVDVARRECIVYLAHTLVMPAFRRGGLASLFRAAPLTLARRAIAAAELDSADILLAAEMEPADRGAVDTLVR